jgi:hypothetical protein
MVDVRFLEELWKKADDANNRLGYWPRLGLCASEF